MVTAFKVLAMAMIPSKDLTHKHAIGATCVTSVYINTKMLTHIMRKKKLLENDT